MTGSIEPAEGLFPTRELLRLEVLLTERFAPSLPPSTVQRCLHEAMASFAGATVRAYLAILVERAATHRLESLLRDQDAEVRHTREGVGWPSRPPEPVPQPRRRRSRRARLPTDPTPATAFAPVDHDGRPRRPRHKEPTS